MTPVKVQQVAGYGGSYNNTYSNDTAPQAGNRLILFSQYYADTPPIVDISGWTRIGMAYDNDGLGHGFSVGVEAWWRTSTGDEWADEYATEYTLPIDWGSGSPSSQVHIITEWSDTATGVTDGPVRTGTQIFSGPLTLASIAPANPGGVLLFLGMPVSDFSNGPVPPDGMTQLAASYDYWLGMETLGAGPTGSRSIDTDPSDGTASNVGLMFVLGAYVAPKIGGLLRTTNVAPVTVARTDPDAPIVVTRTQGG